MKKCNSSLLICIPRGHGHSPLHTPWFPFCNKSIFMKIIQSIIGCDMLFIVEPPALETRRYTLLNCWKPEVLSVPLRGVHQKRVQDRRRFQSVSLQTRARASRRRGTVCSPSKCCRAHRRLLSFCCIFFFFSLIL